MEATTISSGVGIREDIDVLCIRAEILFDGWDD